MCAPEPQVAHVVSAILDGKEVAWPERAEINDDEHGLLAALKLIADVVDFHRDLHDSSSTDRPADGNGPGTRLEEWHHLRVFERVGGGSFGDVYRAWDTRLDREVALKLLPATPPDERGPASIIREGRLMARVRHPNVVAIYGAEQIGDRVGLWMEFVRGRTLAQALHAGRTFAVDEVIDIGIELCRAVAAVHDAGLLHRDVKAHNVALADDGRVVLMDFGAGRELMEGRGSDLAGTPLYLAPEILAGRPATVRSDVYAVGVLLYHLVTGSYPVSGRSLAEIRRRHREGHRVALPDARPGLPGEFAAIVERALTTDPDARYATAHELVSALTAVRDRRARRAKARLPTLVAAAALAAAAVLTFTWWSARESWQGAAASERGEWIQITNFGDSATAPALSPDGRMLAFIRGPDPFFGPGQVYVKSLPDGTPERVTDDELPKMSPVFSPDGSQIAYTTVETRTFRWDTRIVPVHGSTPARTLVNASGLTWIDGRRHLFSEIRKGVHMALVTGADGAKARDVYVPPHVRGMVHRSALSPDGRWALAAEMENQLWLPCRLVPFDGSHRGRPVGPPGAACTEAAWSPDGTWMYVNSNAGGRFHIWRQRFPDGPPVQLTTGPTEEHGIAVAPDGRSIYTSVGITTSTVWIHDAQGPRQVSTEGNAGLPGVAATGAMPRGTYFSPDRQTLYYLVRHGGGATFLDGELWEADLASGRTRAVLPGFRLASFDVSRDGQRLTFAAADAAGRPRVWVGTLDAKTPPKQLSTGDDDNPLFGPRGGIFYRSSHDGANYLYRMNQDGSRRERIVSTPILALHSVSPDGQWVVAYTAVAEPDVSVAVLAHPIAGGAPRRVCNQCKVSWSPSGSHLYVSVPWNGERTYVVPVSPEEPFAGVPREGIRSEADLSRLPVVRVIEQRGTAPTDDGSVYAFTRVEVQRNLYRIPIP